MYTYVHNYNNNYYVLYGSVILLCDDHYQQLNTMWARNLCIFSGCLMDNVSYNMTQIASVLAVATAFIGLWTIIATVHFIAREGGGG